MVALVSRRGRTMQRYNSGCRLVAGCIPYRFRKTDKPSLGDIDQAIEVMVVSSQKGRELMFPKGGWELDESMQAAASREAFEEAGVRGRFEGKLGKWPSKEQDKIHHMFAMRVTEVLPQWPEMNARERKWVSVGEAREVCKHAWMREALDKLHELLSTPSGQDNCSAQHALTTLTENSILSCTSKLAGFNDSFIYQRNKAGK
ncbi:hypothetical protein OPV22_006539 [Ensete ventricosum]|uniref:Nudix hydrolase domain-containing protein n=1 Tax=Ensete ventricosum TaxID=4639 RepID=A0AAV8RJ06_ENSVE|nr:hypothetical protein OPV22_006539 [Ensete ventricosum]